MPTTWVSALQAHGDQQAARVGKGRDQRVDTERLQSAASGRSHQEDWPTDLEPTSSLCHPKPPDSLRGLPRLRGVAHLALASAAASAPAGPAGDHGADGQGVGVARAEDLQRGQAALARIHKIA
jgi:hypothetical protein